MVSHRHFNEQATRVGSLLIVCTILLGGGPIEVHAQDSATPMIANPDTLGTTNGQAAIENNGPPPPPATTKALSAEMLAHGLKTEKMATQDAAEARFKGFGFGLGIALSYGVERVEEAIIDSAGRVRITKSSKALPRILLETHFFVPIGSTHRDPDTGNEIAPVGVGPFVGIQSSDGSVLESFSLGVLLGFRRDKKQGVTSDSFNLGIGIIVDRSVKTLGDGFYEGQPPPAGETEIRYKESSQAGLLITTSFSF